MEIPHFIPMGCWLFLCAFCIISINQYKILLLDSLQSLVFLSHIFCKIQGLTRLASQIIGEFQRLSVSERSCHRMHNKQKNKMPEQLLAFSANLTGKNVSKSSLLGNFNQLTLKLYDRGHNQHWTRGGQDILMGIRLLQKLWEPTKGIHVVIVQIYSKERNQDCCLTTSGKHALA